MNKPVEDKNLNYKAIGKRLKIRRSELDFTQEQVAELAKISTSFIGHIERGEKKASVETLATLSEVLDMDLNYMILGICRNDETKRIIQEIETILDRYR